MIELEIKNGTSRVLRISPRSFSSITNHKVLIGGQIYHFWPIRKELRESLHGLEFLPGLNNWAIHPK